MINFNVMKIDDRAIIPTQATEGSACFDISVIPKFTFHLQSIPSLNPLSLYKETVKKTTYIIHNPFTLFHTGIKTEFNKEYVFHLYERSSLFKNYQLDLVNKIGIIDSDYRGEIIIPLRYHNLHSQLNTLNVEEGDNPGELYINHPNNRNIDYLLLDDHVVTLDIDQLINMLTGLYPTILFHHDRLKEHIKTLIDIEIQQHQEIVQVGKPNQYLKVELDLNTIIKEELEPVRLCQGTLLPVQTQLQIQEVGTLSDTDRGEGGFGSTNR